MRLEKYRRTEYDPHTGMARPVLDDVELVQEPTDEAINRALNDGDTALVLVVCGGESVVLSHRKADNLETLISQIRLLLG